MRAIAIGSSKMAHGGRLVGFESSARDSVGAFSTVLSVASLLGALGLMLSRGLASVQVLLCSTSEGKVVSSSVRLRVLKLPKDVRWLSCCW